MLISYLTLVPQLIHTSSCGQTNSIFKNVVVHLGDFHFMKENFQVSFVTEEKFENTLLL